MLLAITIAIAKEGAHLGQYEWAVPYLLAAIVVCFVLALISLRKEGRQQNPTAPIHIENRLENIGNPMQMQAGVQRVAAPVPLRASPFKPQPPEVKAFPSRIAQLHDFYNFAPGTPMVLVPFRNDSVFGQDQEFQAQLIYKDTTGNEIANVARGTWFPLTKNPTKTEFETGVVHELALLFIDQGKYLRPEIDWRWEGSGRRAFRFPEPRTDQIEGVNSIEARLLSGTNAPIIFHFDLIKDAASSYPLLRRRD